MAYFDVKLLSPTLLQVALASGIFFALIFFVKLYRVRRYVRQLQKQGLVRLFPHSKYSEWLDASYLHFLPQPMPPHHPLWGHLAISADIVRSLPPLAHGNYLGDEFRKRYSYLKTSFYLDNWPFSPLILIVQDPNMMYQFTQAKTLPKYEGLRRFLLPLTGGETLVTVEGPVWKRWRAIFSPGFSLNHIMTLVPNIVEEMMIFKNIIQAHAEKSDIFHLEQLSLNLAIDIIGRVAMYVAMYC